MNYGIYLNGKIRALYYCSIIIVYMVLCGFIALHIIDHGLGISHWTTLGRGLRVSHLATDHWIVV